MCGIIGVYSINGIDDALVSRFDEMLKRCQKRGYDATGVVNGSMRCIKASVPAETFIKTPRFKEWCAETIGMKFAIGHCRQATRGLPSDNANNHPIPVMNDGRKIFMVHNGNVDCKKWDLDENKGIKDKERTDTYIFANAIKDYISKNDNCSLYESVKSSFEDIERNSVINSSVIVVVDEKEIVICKSREKPLLMQSVGGCIFFASEREILNPIKVTEDGVDVIRYKVLCDHSIVGINIVTGEMKEDLLDTMPKPTPTYEIVDRDIHSHTTRKSWVKSTRGGKVDNTRGTSILEFTETDFIKRSKMVDDDFGLVGKKKLKKKKGKKKTAIQSVMERQISTDDIEDWDDDDESIISDDDEDDAESLICTKCVNCSYGDDDEFTMDPNPDYVECNLYGFEMPVQEARRCPDYFRRGERGHSGSIFI